MGKIGMIFNAILIRNYTRDKKRQKNLIAIQFILVHRLTLLSSTAGKGGRGGTRAIGKKSTKSIR